MTDNDRREHPSTMEPMLLPQDSLHRASLSDLALELAASSAGFRRSLPEGIHNALGDLVRSMNCYYSNLIEGHNTHPVDIERAMKNDYSADSRKRNLQLEAKAHVAVQEWIDQGGLQGRAASVEALCEIHKRFCKLLPEELLIVKDPDTGEEARVIPGQLRDRDVRVENLVPVSPGALPRFLGRFEDVYSDLGTTDTILAAPTAHHRLLWIHPFLDGNGRVARLMSHAVLLETLDTGGAWSIARGLARRVSDYKAHLMDCDSPRRNDLDGRGTLSEEALAVFARFFLETCLDQVRFMESLVEPARLRGRILGWAEEEIRADRLPGKAGNVLEAILYRGELPRGEVAGVLGTGDRQARRIASALLERGVLTSAGPKAPLLLTFPATLASIWMPGLFPPEQQQ